MNAIRVLITFAMFSFTITTNAEITVAQHRLALQAGGRPAELEQTYVAGLGRGMWVTNYYAKLFCPPTAFVANAQNFLQWLDREIEGNPKITPTEDYIEVVLLGAMVKVFPCTKH